MVPKRVTPPISPPKTREWATPTDQLFFRKTIGNATLSDERSHFKGYRVFNRIFAIFNRIFIRFQGLSECRVLYYAETAMQSNFTSELYTSCRRAYRARAGNVPRRV